MMNRNMHFMILLTRRSGEYETGPALILLQPSSLPVRSGVVTYILTEEQSIDI